MQQRLTLNVRKPPDEPLNLSNKSERTGHNAHTSEANGKIAGTCCFKLLNLIRDKLAILVNEE